MRIRSFTLIAIKKKLCQTAGCDLVGFHIDDYALNFLDCCQRCLGCLTDKNTMYTFPYFLLLYE